LETFHRKGEQKKGVWPGGEKKTPEKKEPGKGGFFAPRVLTKGGLSHPRKKKKHPLERLGVCLSKESERGPQKQKKLTNGSQDNLYTEKCWKGARKKTKKPLWVKKKVHAPTYCRGNGKISSATLQITAGHKLANNGVGGGSLIQEPGVLQSQ